MTRLRVALGGIGPRFAALLAAALVAALAIAAGLFAFDRARGDEAAIVERELERIVSLVPAIEAAAPATRGAIAAAASTRLSRVSVDTAPAMAAQARAPRSAALTRALQQALPGRDVRAAILLRRGEDGARGARVVLSIALPGGGQWLNVASRAGRPPPGLPARFLAVVLCVSLVLVLGVALVFLCRLTRPLRALAAAADAAGRGDRSARVPEAGPAEIRAAAAAFNAMQKRIAAFEAERMRTLAAVGHDLRTPITSLRIRAEMLDDPAAPDMISTLDDMAVMADGLVHWGQGGAEAEAPRDLDLAALLTRCCAERGIPCNAAPARVRGRPVALGRMIGNLLDNAQRYATGARATLRVEAGTACLAVEDRGPGIPKDRLAAMLEPFVRGEASRNAETGGAGLGLAIADGIARAHGGSLRLENRAGGGLRAAVRLPVAP